MTKLALAVSLISLCAAGGLVVMNAGLQDRIVELEDRLESAEKSPEKSSAVTRTAERSATRAAASRVDPRVDDLEGRLKALESRAADAPEAASRATDGTAVELPAGYAGTDFQEAVTAVLDARDERRRVERMERDSGRRVKRLVRDLELDDGRVAQLTAVTLDYVRRRYERRDEINVDDREAKLAIEAELQEEYRTALATVLTTEEMSTIESRLNPRRRAQEAGGRSRRRQGGQGGRDQ